MDGIEVGIECVRWLRGRGQANAMGRIEGRWFL